MPEWHNSEWQVETRQAPILDGVSTEQYEADLGLPMPEMLFGQNFVRIVHAGGAELVFTAKDALRGVDLDVRGKPHALKVAHTQKWRESKIKHKEQAPIEAGQIDYDVDRVHKPFDWTYSTDYKGTMHGFEQAYISSDPEDSRGIPYDELQKREPLSFFDSVLLYEDELGDCGLCSYSVKIRVMPGALFALARMYMRVDGVALRVRDTRVYVRFGTGELVREYTEREAPYSEVRAAVPVWQEQDYSRLLRDAQWVASHLPVVHAELAVYVPEKKG